MGGVSQAARRYEMKNKIARGFRRFVSWLFGSPFRNLPPGMDEPVPEIEEFEARVDKIQQQEHDNLSLTGESTPHRKSDTIHKE
jgi:hypothetical protein